jgi:hypothetical protein
LLVITFSQNLYSQDWNSARLSVIYGGSIPFNFNSIRSYVEGIEITEGTILGISLKSENQPGHELEGFDIRIRSFNAAGTIKGDAGDLSLDRIRVKAENYLGLEEGISFGYLELSSSWTTLFSYSDPDFSDLTWDLNQLVLSFECGKPVSEGGTGSLLGEIPDFYTVEIEIELVPTGPGF